MLLVAPADVSVHIQHDSDSVRNISRACDGDINGREAGRGPRHQVGQICKTETTCTAKYQRKKWNSHTPFLLYPLEDVLKSPKKRKEKNLHPLLAFPVCAHTWVYARARASQPVWERRAQARLFHSASGCHERTKRQPREIKTCCFWHIKYDLLTVVYFAPSSDKDTQLLNSKYLHENR